MKKKAYIAIAMCAAISCTIALADWVPNDPTDPTNHIMTQPRLPLGRYDIMVDANKPLSAPFLADDWVAAGTREVRDVHIWTSWNRTPSTVTGVGIGIFADNEAGDAPGNLEWYGEFRVSTGGYTQPQLYSTIDNGLWYNPWNSDTGEPHTEIFQINIPDLLAASNVRGSATPGEYFVQQNGETYWLSVVIEVEDPQNGELGWHTAVDTDANGGVAGGAIYGSGAVWSTDLNDIAFTAPNWAPLSINNAPVDLAFVMTPEPSAFGLLLLVSASLGIVRRKRG